jgi:hypothetical protein
LVFECLLNDEYQKENVFVMIFNLLKTEHQRISKFLIEYIIDIMVLICLKHFTILREIDHSLVEEEKKLIKTIFNYFDFYMNFKAENINANENDFNRLIGHKKNSIVRNIIIVYCFFVNYDRESCWKMMKSFLQNESVNIMKYFLEIIYNESLFSNTSFSGLDEYFYYDSDEEFGLTSYFDKIFFFENLHKNFLNKLGDINGLLAKHKIKIIKGSIFYIGMSLWGYERLDIISIPNTIVLSHFSKLVNYSNIKIDMEIILCVRRLIKKYGEILSDEWNDIFKMLSVITNRNCTENLIKNIYEITDAIKMLIVSNKFFGNLNQFSNLLDSFKIIQSESLIILKTKLKLSNNCLFIANLESFIIEHLLK